MAISDYLELIFENNAKADKTPPHTHTHHTHTHTDKLAKLLMYVKPRQPVRHIKLYTTE